ncbi:MAG TPA: hypothetical protein VFF00_03635 [Candidatus Elarobacter sp.]|nr:hypothetical protein [Candidatus Elarobacter sp.]
MSAAAEALWLRALHAAHARGLLPPKSSGLTPAEVAAAVAQRGEDRLARLVQGWYYPTSYGRAAGALSDDEASRLVAALEAEVVPVEVALAPVAVRPPPARPKNCELCGFPLPPSASERGA